MARDDFFSDLRNAVTFMAPRVEADIPFTDSNYIQGLLRASDSWLTSKVIEKFQPKDFADIDDGVREALSKALEQFRDALKLTHNGLALPGPADAALLPFTEIVKIAQSLVLADWVSASSDLLREAEQWAKDQEWPTRRFPKDITEDFIGNYKLDKLVYSAEGAQLALVPLGRFAPGTDGMFDLAVMPAYDSVMVVREKNRWYIHPLPEEEGRLDWSKDAFIAKSLKLARLS